MSITAIARNFDGNPNLVTIISTDDLTTITTTGYWTTPAIMASVELLQNGDFQWSDTDLVLMYYATAQIGFFTYDAATTSFVALAPNGGISSTLPSADILVGNASNVATAAAMSGDATISNTGVVTIAASVTSAAGTTFTNTTASATPGTIRALKGLEVSTNATMTSGSLVGVRGEVDMVGASGGFVYGVQGKVIPTGTLSGSIWAPAVFGQYDLSAATINAGQIAAIWGDMGATGGTFTNVTGARMFAGTNTIASLTLNSMIYLYGKATSLFELSGSSSTYISAGAATPSGDLKKIAITIDGVVHYILAAAVWS